MPISPLPSLDRNGPNFRADVDAYFVSALPTFSSQAEAARVEILASAATTAGYADQVYANTVATASNVAAMANYANAQPWAAGVYALGVIVTSPANKRLYRKKTASSSTATDPSADATNWEVVSPLLRLTTELRGSAVIAAGVLALDLANAVTSVPLNANITSLTLANNLASGTACQVHTLELYGDGTQRTVVWPNGDGTSSLKFSWPSGVAPVLSSTNGKVDTFLFKSRAQYVWDAYVVGQAT